ncbi:hypothetical protein ACJ41O_001964 [Fusarium nematophilum]
MEGCPLSREDLATTVGVVEATDRAMGPNEVRKVAKIIADRFSHIPFAITGHAAMTYYGYEEAKPFHVSVICPDHSREALACWARTQGMLVIPDKRDTWGVMTDDGFIRQVQVRFLEDFEHVQVIRGAGSSAKVLSLVAVADEIARTYVKELKYAGKKRQDGLGRDMRWVLKKIASLKIDGLRLNPNTAPHLVQETFWLPFTLSYPDTVPLFAEAGWPIPQLTGGEEDGCTDI